MILKAISRGDGNARVGTDYLTSDFDNKGARRDAVRCVRGNPEAFGQLVNGLSFVNRYTSLLIAFAPEDDPDDGEILDVLKDFELQAFPGLNRSQYAMLVVGHRSPESIWHFHIFVCCAELYSLRKLNIAPPQGKAWMKEFAEKWNYAKGWARPDDPSRRRLLSLGRNRDQPIVTALKVQITELLLEQIVDGKITNWSGTVEALSRVGKILRFGRNWVSLSVPECDGPVHLKGALYGSDFNLELIGALAKAAHGRPTGRSPPNRAASEEARSRLECINAIRAIDFETRFGGSSRGDHCHAEKNVSHAPLDVLDSRHPDDSCFSNGDGVSNDVQPLENSTGRSIGRGTACSDRINHKRVLQQPRRKKIVQIEVNDEAKPDGIERNARRYLDVVLRAARSTERVNRAVLRSHRRTLEASRRFEAVAVAFADAFRDKSEELARKRDYSVSQIWAVADAWDNEAEDIYYDESLTNMP